MLLPFATGRSNASSSRHDDAFNGVSDESASPLHRLAAAAAAAVISNGAVQDAAVGLVQAVATHAIAFAAPVAELTVSVRPAPGAIESQAPAAAPPAAIATAAEGLIADAVAARDYDVPAAALARDAAVVDAGAAVDSALRQVQQALQASSANVNVAAALAVEVEAAAAASPRASTARSLADRRRVQRPRRLSSDDEVSAGPLSAICGTAQHIVTPSVTMAQSHVCPSIQTVHDPKRARPDRICCLGWVPTSDIYHALPRAGSDQCGVQHAATNTLFGMTWSQMYFVLLCAQCHACSWCRWKPRGRICRTTRQVLLTEDPLVQCCPPV